MNRKKERFLFFLAISLSLVGIGTILSSPLFLERRASYQEIYDEQVPGIESDLLESTANLGTDESKSTTAYQSNERTTSRASSAGTTSTTILQDHTKETTTRTTSTTRITESSISSSIFDSTTKGSVTSSIAAEPASSTLLSSTPTSSHVTISSLVTTALITTTSTTTTPTATTTISTTTTTPPTTTSTTTPTTSITTTPTTTATTSTATTTTRAPPTTTPTTSPVTIITTNPTITATTTTTALTTTTPLSCEDNICQQGGICLNQNVPVEKCEDFYTGVDCEVPPTFVRQQDQNGNFLKTSFIDALNVCRSQGGYLAFFINEDEYLLYIEKERKTTNMEYIGYHTCNHPNFINADGKNSRYEIWDEGEPNNYDGNENCGSIFGGERNKMNDYNCDAKLEFACRFPRLNTCEDYFCHYGNVCDYSQRIRGKPDCPGVQGNQECTTTTTTTTCKTFIFEKQRDNQGKFLKKDYKNAHEICRKKGGYVAYFLNQDEFDEFKSQSDRTDEKEYLGYFSCDHPNFLYANGDEALFTDWNTNGEPNNHDGIEFCTELLGKKKNNKMNDIKCTDSKEFSCRLPQNC